MQSYDAYLKEQKRFYQVQYRFFYQYLKHQQEAAQNLECFVGNLYSFVPSYACQLCLKPMLQQLAKTLQTVYLEFNAFTVYMTSFLPDLFVDNEIKAISTVYKQHKALANNIQNSKTAYFQGDALYQNQIAYNQQFVKAAASFEYDRIRKMRQFCYQTANSFTRLGAKIIEQTPKLHTSCGEIAEFAGHFDVCRRFSGLDCGQSLESILGIEGLSNGQDKKEHAKKKSKYSPDKTVVHQVVLHSGDSPTGSYKQIMLRAEPEDQYTYRLKVDANPVAQPPREEPQNPPRVQLMAQPQDTEYFHRYNEPRPSKSPFKVPRFDFGDSLLDDGEDVELQLNMPQVAKQPEDTSTASVETYGLYSLLEKQKQLEELQRILDRDLRNDE